MSNWSEESITKFENIVNGSDWSFEVDGDELLFNHSDGSELTAQYSEMINEYIIIFESGDREESFREGRMTETVEDDAVNWMKKILQE